MTTQNIYRKFQCIILETKAVSLVSARDHCLPSHNNITRVHVSCMAGLTYLRSDGEAKLLKRSSRFYVYASAYTRTGEYVKYIHDAHHTRARNGIVVKSRVCMNPIWKPGCCSETTKEEGLSRVRRTGRVSSLPGRAIVAPGYEKNKSRSSEQRENRPCLAIYDVIIFIGTRKRMQTLHLLEDYSCRALGNNVAALTVKIQRASSLSHFVRIMIAL